jgi:hypothetical protein
VPNESCTLVVWVELRLIESGARVQYLVVQARQIDAGHAGKYVEGLASAAKRAGARIYTGTEVGEVQGGASAHVMTTNGISVIAPFAVVASDTPFNDRIAMHTKQAAYRTYMIGVPVPSATIYDALYWDTADPFHYVRLVKTVDSEKSRDVLLIGGEDHKTGQTEEIENRFARLLSWGQTYFGDLGHPEFRWSGQIMNSMDGLAFIGRNPGDPNVFIVTGDSGVGLTHGTIAGILITDLIQGRRNPWETLYDPSRKMVRAAAEFARENLNTAGQYVDWLSAGDVADPAEIRPGSGAIVRDGLTKIAVYRDDSGALHRCSAVCPHLGGIVAWNPTESVGIAHATVRGSTLTAGSSTDLQPLRSNLFPRSSQKSGLPTGSIRAAFRVGRRIKRGQDYSASCGLAQLNSVRQQKIHRLPFATRRSFEDSGVGSRRLCTVVQAPGSWSAIWGRCACE